MNFCVKSKPGRLHAGLCRTIVYISVAVTREEKTQIAGVSVVCDCSGFSLKHFRSMSLTDMKFAAMIAQVCL